MRTQRKPIKIFLDGIRFAGSIDYVLITSYSDFETIITSLEEVEEISLGYRLRDGFSTFKAIALIGKLIEKGHLKLGTVKVHVVDKIIKRKLESMLKEQGVLGDA